MYQRLLFLVGLLVCCAWPAAAAPAAANAPRSTTDSEPLPAVVSGASLELFFQLAYTFDSRTEEWGDARRAAARRCDLDANGHINTRDLLACKAAWLRRPAPSAPQPTVTRTTTTDDRTAHD